MKQIMKWNSILTSVLFPQICPRNNFDGIFLYANRTHWKIFHQDCSMIGIWYPDHKNPRLMIDYFANGPGDLGSIPGRVIPKTFKMVLDTSLLNTLQYKVSINGKMEQS